jgi:hypothetical protein
VREVCQEGGMHAVCPQFALDAVTTAASTAAQYRRFFDWAVRSRPESWVAFYFCAISADCVTGGPVDTRRDQRVRR